MAKATIGTIIGELAELGAVVESESLSEGRGRPGRPIRFVGGAFVGLGFELNVDYVAAVALDLAGDVVLSEVRPLLVGESRPESLLALAREVAARLSGSTLVGATLAIPGLVGPDNRTMSWTPNLGLEGSTLADDLEEALQVVEEAEGRGRLEATSRRVTVRVDNDANCAALAEAHRGAAMDAGHMLYLTGTVGIGAGIVQDGRLMRGASGFAGEVGHMPLGDPDAKCGCGRRGCWEASVGLLAMLAATGMEEVDNPIRSAELVAARALVDPDAFSAVRILGEQVGHGLAMLSDVLDPAVIVLGGYFVPLGDLIVDPVKRVIRARAGTRRPPPEIRLSTLGIQAAALGAAEESLRPTFSGESPLVG